MEDTIKYISEEKVLEKQLKSGVPTGSYDFLNYNDTDLLATVPMLKKALLANGFRFQINNIFREKVKSIFGRTIDTSAPTKLLYINFYNKCSPQIIYHPNCADVQGTFIVKNEGFITDFYLIPQIVDYQKKHASLNHIEDEKIIIHDDLENTNVEIKRWKNEVGLNEERMQNIQTVVARNMYLFNDNKAYVPYLVSKDPTFVERLVKIFGYTKEPAFNKFVLEKYAGKITKNEYDVVFLNYENNDDIQNFGEIIFSRDCDKHLAIRKDLLDYIDQHTDSVNTKLMATLFYYVSDLSENDKSSDLYKKYILSERRKIIAYTSSIFDRYYLTTTGPRSIGLPENIKKSLLAYTLHYDPAAEQEYKLHNYYGLPNLKELIDTIKTGYWMDGPWE